MSHAPLTRSHRNDLKALRDRLQLSDLSAEARGLNGLICRDMLQTIGDEVVAATAQHPQSCSRRELLHHAVHVALDEFVHLVDPDQPPPRWVSRLFQRLGRAEADASWEIDVVLAALESMHSAWSRSATSWGLTSSHTFPAQVARGFTGYLVHLHRAAVQGQCEALHEGTFPLRTPRPEQGVHQLVHQWRSSSPTFDVRVRTQRGYPSPGRLGSSDHTVAVSPHPSLPGAVDPMGVSVLVADVSAHQVLAAYRDGLLGLRLAEAGLVPTGDLTLPEPGSGQVPLHPGRAMVSRVASTLAPLTALDLPERTAVAQALQTRLHDHSPGIHLPQLRRRSGVDDHAVLDALHPHDPTMSGQRLATLAVLRLVIPLWIQTSA